MFSYYSLIPQSIASENVYRSQLTGKSKRNFLEFQLIIKLKAKQNATPLGSLYKRVSMIKRQKRINR